MIAKKKKRQGKKKQEQLNLKKFFYHLFIAILAMLVGGIILKNVFAHREQYQQLSKQCGYAYTLGYNMALACHLNSPTVVKGPNPQPLKACYFAQ